MFYFGFDFWVVFFVVVRIEGVFGCFFVLFFSWH